MNRACFNCRFIQVLGAQAGNATDWTCGHPSEDDLTIFPFIKDELTASNEDYARETAIACTGFSCKAEAA